MMATVDRAALHFLGLSVALHAVLLIGLPDWSAQRAHTAKPVLSISFQMAEHAAAMPQREVPVAPSAALSPEVRQSRTRLPNAAAERTQTTAGPTAQPARTARPEPTPAAHAQLAKSFTETLVNPLASVDQPPPLAPALPSPTAAPRHPAVDPALALQAYGLRLKGLFASQIDYPPIAALRGWEGEVRLRLRVARKGSLLAVTVDHSSGFGLLDQHALAWVSGLKSLPPFPEELDLAEVQLLVPIHYKLKKTI